MHALNEALKAIQAANSDYATKMDMVVGRIESLESEKIRGLAELISQKEQLRLQEASNARLSKSLEERSASISIAEEANKSEAKRLQAEAKRLEKEEERINKKHEAYLSEVASLQESKQELDKRMKWAEMEERRLMFLDKKLKLISEDKEIARKLKELE